MKGGIAVRITTTINPYLEGDFAPVGDERNDGDLEVSGAIPPELTGLLLRNGPNPISPPDPANYHWFIGDGMLHGLELSGGKARYANRWVRTERAAQSLGEPAPGAVAVANAIHSVANTSVVAHAGRIYALVETALPTLVRPDLSTIGAFDFDRRLKGTFTAHPKIDPASGEMHFFGYEIFNEPYVNYHVVDANGVLVRTQAIDIPRPVMMHSFGVTATRIVWLDLPVVFDLGLASRLPFPCTWRPENGARLGIMNRGQEDAKVTWIEIEPCYVFHELNAYDDADGNVVIDVVRYPDMFATDIYGPGSSSARLERWTVDPGAATVRTELLDDVPQEFPRINDLFQGKRHRFGYSTEIDIGETWFRTGSLRKHDLAAGRSERHDVGAGRAAGEPIFVPAPDEAGEDAGWILSMVYDAGRDASDLVVIDAADFAAAPVAVIHLPRRVPFGFHGSWIPGASLG
jgi:carotenoid cleavage dioxygenase